MAERSEGRLLPAIVTFVVVAGGIWVTGLLATALLKNVVLPVVAILLGWSVARFVYKIRD